MEDNSENFKLVYAPERILIDEDYESNNSDSPQKNKHDSDEDDLRHMMDMMEIEMTFGGGKQDVIVVHWGDDPHTLAKEFVHKHSLKISSIGSIANHISATIEAYKKTLLLDSSIHMQSPSFDDNEHTEHTRTLERSEYDELLSKQHFSREINTQNSLRNEPMDLPDTNNLSQSQPPSQLVSPTSLSLGALSSLNSSQFSSSSPKIITSLSQSPASSFRSTQQPAPEMTSHSASLLNHWAQLNTLKSSASSSHYEDSNILSSTYDNQSSDMNNSTRLNETSTVDDVSPDRYRERERGGGGDTTFSASELLVSPGSSVQVTESSEEGGPLSLPRKKDQSAVSNNNSHIGQNHTPFLVGSSTTARLLEQEETKQSYLSSLFQDYNHQRSIEDLTLSPIRMGGESPSSLAGRSQSMTSSFPTAKSSHNITSNNSNNSMQDTLPATRSFSDPHSYKLVRPLNFADSNENSDMNSNPVAGIYPNTASITPFTNGNNSFKKVNGKESPPRSKTSRGAAVTSTSSSSSYSSTSAPSKCTADVYNKLKSEWLNGTNSVAASRRKSVTSAVMPPPPQQVSLISGIKQRSTLVVSKAVGHSGSSSVYGGSVIRQPLDTSEQKTISPPKKNRLYEDALTQLKRREILQQRADEREEAVRRQHVFRMSQGSKKLNNSIGRKDADLEVGERLYNEAAVINKKKEDKSRLWHEHKETALTDWSCLRCGTYNKITLNPDSKRPVSVYVCSSCGVSCDLETIEQSLFCPTNTARLTDSNEAALGSRLNSYDNIYEYLYANKEMETKKLQLLKESWEDEDEVLTFRPVIPEHSKKMLLRFRKRLLSEEANALNEINTSQSSRQYTTADTKAANKSKIVVSEVGLEAYVNLPLTERLSKAETLCRVVKPELPLNKENDVRKSPSLTSEKKSESKLDDLFSRLTYEYIDKANRRETERQKIENFNPLTGKEYFKPTIGQPPSSTFQTAVFFDQDKKESIYDKLLRKGHEAKQRLKEVKDKVLLKEKSDIEKNFTQALPRSKIILKESSNQCIEEIFKLLIANQLFFQSNRALLSQADKDGREGRGDIAQRNRLKMTAEYLSDIAEKLENFHNLSLDIRTVDPNLVVEDVQDLLSDIRTLGLQNATALQADLVSKGNNDALKIESCFSVTFMQFKSMIKQCTAKRAGGVGKSYIYTPKPRDTAVKQMIAEESKECTFRPHIDSRSNELALSKGRGQVSIESILADEEYLRKQRIEHIKGLINEKETKECTFKPMLYAPPKSVIPTYRGQTRELVPPEKKEVSFPSTTLDDDMCDVSVITSSTDSTLVKPTATSNEGVTDSFNNLKPQIRQNKNKAVDTSPLSKENAVEESLVHQKFKNGVRVDISQHVRDAATDSRNDISRDVTLRWARQNDLS